MNQTREFTVKKCEKETLTDGSEVLAIELLTTDEDGNPQTIHDVIQTQERLDQFLVSIGFKPGQMTLKTKSQ